MFAAVDKPRVMILGLSLQLYKEVLPGYMERLERQLERLIEPLTPAVELAGCRLCWSTEQVNDGIQRAERAEADALLLVPVSYTASGMTAGAVARTKLPIVIWNTQELSAINENYDFDVLLMNHVAQGTQDLTNVLLRNGVRFGMETGHYRDAAAISRLTDWLIAARAAVRTRTMRIGLLGEPFKDMNDFAFDEARIRDRWGPTIVRLPIPRLAELAAQADPRQVQAAIEADRQHYEVSAEVTDQVHNPSARLAWAMRKIVEENRLDALSMNFMDLIADRRFETLPFLGINQLMAEGLGYAGEGDVVTAGHVAQLRQLCGAANFTEIFTVDYQRNRMLMMHMQECNPALARRDRPVRLVRKDFWAPGIQPYVGMYFTLEPGPVTLTCMTSDPGGDLYYLACQTQIVDRPPLPGLDVPHWMVQLDEPAGDFLTRYSLAGGPHHLAAAPGHHARRLEMLAHLQGLRFRRI